MEWVAAARSAISAGEKMAGPSFRVERRASKSAAIEAADVGDLVMVAVLT